MAEKQAETSPSAVLPPGRWVTLLIVSIGVIALIGFPLLKISRRPSLRITTCFQDVGGLRSGASVRVAGVDVGSVLDVRAQPTERDCPGAVGLELRTSYDLKLPNDSVASISTAGVLGATYLAIDVSKASGPPIQSGGRLPSRENQQFSLASLDQALKALDGVSKRLSDLEKKGNAPPARTPPEAKPSTKPSPLSPAK
jgi:phospholipid/cholesterol/gamma-HCH transport system substrate-binding protein